MSLKSPRGVTNVPTDAFSLFVYQKNLTTRHGELADRNPPECKRASSAAEHRRYSNQCAVNSVSSPLEKAIYASCPASSQMQATWRTLTKRPISLSAVAQRPMTALTHIVSTPNPSLGRMRRRLRVEFSIKNHCKIALSTLFQCYIRLQLRRDHHQGSPDPRKD